MPGIEDLIPAADEPETFAMMLNAILAADDESWLEAANDLGEFGYANFSKERGWESLRQGLALGGLCERRAKLPAMRKTTFYRSSPAWPRSMS